MDETGGFFLLLASELECTNVGNFNVYFGYGRENEYFVSALKNAFRHPLPSKDFGALNRPFLDVPDLGVVLDRYVNLIAYPDQLEACFKM